ncbi:unnamed protein product, partial [Brassica oleracea var. botrytis]
MASQRVIITSPFIFRQICCQIRKPKPWALVSFPSSMHCFYGDIFGRVAGYSTSSSAAQSSAP